MAGRGSGRKRGRPRGSKGRGRAKADKLPLAIAAKAKAKTKKSKLGSIQPRAKVARMPRVNVKAGQISAAAAASEPQLCEDCRNQKGNFGLLGDMVKRWCSECAATHEGAMHIRLGQCEAGLLTQGRCPVPLG